MDASQRALAFLNRNNIAVVATVDEARKCPEAATIYYFANGDFNLYFITRRSTRKYRNMLTRPRVALVIGPSEQCCSIQIEGRAQQLESDEDIGVFFGILGKHPELYNQYFGALRKETIFPKAQEGDVALFKVHTDWVRLMELDPVTRLERYEQIIG